MYLYPVKSLGGVEVGAAEVRERGFQYDRRWMLVDTEGKFMTQRSHREMALIQTTQTGGNFVLSHKKYDHGVTKIPAEVTTAHKTITVYVWNDTLEALWPQLEADRWISAILGQECRLVYMPKGADRLADVRYYPQKSNVSFADSFPYLLTSEDSLNDLNARSGTAFDVRRFRPNIVVSGAGAYEEDRWETIRIGDVLFRLVKSCARCVVTTVDPETAWQGTEPLRTLAAYRKKGGKILFGQNMVAEGPGSVSVGDPVEVLAWKEGH